MSNTTNLKTRKIIRYKYNTALHGSSANPTGGSLYPDVEIDWSYEGGPTGPEDGKWPPPLEIGPEGNKVMGWWVGVGGLGGSYNYNSISFPDGEYNHVDLDGSGFPLFSGRAGGHITAGEETVPPTTIGGTTYDYQFGPIPRNLGIYLAGRPACGLNITFDAGTGDPDNPPGNPFNLLNNNQYEIRGSLEIREGVHNPGTPGALIETINLSQLPILGGDMDLVIFSDDKMVDCCGKDYHFILKYADAQNLSFVYDKNAGSYVDPPTGPIWHVNYKLYVDTEPAEYNAVELAEPDGYVLPFTCNLVGNESWEYWNLKYRFMIL